jgi:hypothetical protein
MDYGARAAQEALNDAGMTLMISMQLSVARLSGFSQLKNSVIFQACYLLYLRQTSQS